MLSYHPILIDPFILYSIIIISTSNSIPHYLSLHPLIASTILSYYSIIPLSSVSATHIIIYSLHYYSPNYPTIYPLLLIIYVIILSDLITISLHSITHIIMAPLTTSSSSPILIYPLPIIIISYIASINPYLPLIMVAILIFHYLTHPTQYLALIISVIASIFGHSLISIISVFITLIYITQH